MNPIGTPSQSLTDALGRLHEQLADVIEDSADLDSTSRDDLLGYVMAMLRRLATGLQHQQLDAAQIRSNMDGLIDYSTRLHQGRGL